MRTLRSFSSTISAVLSLAMQAAGQPPDVSAADRPPDRNVIAYGMRAEGAMMSWLRDVSPVGEGYLQGFVPAKKLGHVLSGDRYSLGRFQWVNDPRLENLLGVPSVDGEVTPEKAAADQQLLDGLVETMVPDWRGLSPERYEYKFVRREFLGALRCLVYDVTPRSPEDGVFAGRIYLEERTWNLVRFTGMNRRVDSRLKALRDNNSRFRIDGWRVNVTGNRWAPAFAFIEESLPLGSPESRLVKGQVRFWGYDKAPPPRQDQFTEVKLVKSVSTVSGAGPRGCSPQQCERQFESQAEENVLDRLFQAKLLGVPGDVEQKLEQVLTNLEVPNRLVLAQAIRCRLLLTTRLEAFTVGNTIVLSRGLVDVLPGESAIALVLAHQLAHNDLGHRKIDSNLGFPDVLRISDAELLAKLRFRHTPEEEKAADERAMQILRASMYQQKMSECGLAMQALQAYAPRLSHLIQPSFGEHVADAAQVVRDDDMFRIADVLDEESAEQVAGLPLGSNLMVNPWNGKVELLRSEKLPALAAHERAEFAVTPFVPYLDYFVENPAPSKPPATAPRPTVRRTNTPVRPTAVAVKKGS